MIRRIFNIAARETGIMARTPIYLFAMVIFPIIVVIFFTSLLGEGQPENMPCGVVDNDKTTVSRALIRQLDAFQNTKVTTHFNNPNEARRAIQRNEIYGFLYIPNGTTEKLVSGRQPTVSFYYSNVTLLAGSMLFKDLKTITTLGSAAMGQAKLQMLGKTDKEIKATLQPIVIDAHMPENPYMNYNIYLTNVMVPGIFILFILLITAYSIGTELKFDRSREWMQMAGKNIFVALTGKMLPQFLIFFTVFTSYEWYIYGHLGFPHPGGLPIIFLLGILIVISSQGLGIFFFGLMPSLRLSMSVCSLWAVVGFSAAGATYPTFAMDPMIEAVAELIPLRHYYMIQQMTIFHGYPLINAWWNFSVLILFTLLPLLTARNIRKAMLEYVYIP
ncbi:UNVERIFIED_CONTAM: ABC transporter permease [Prevotella sp. 15_C9]